MHFQFLIEDWSGEVLIHQIMEKYKEFNHQISFDCKSFRGIGTLPKGANPKEVKANTILKSLPYYLKAFDRSLKGIEAALFIIVDNDKKQPDVFRRELEHTAEETLITIDYVFCIAVEEMEAWLLGDRDAIEKAYPNARMNAMSDYEQDSICGTWEKLASVVYKGGLKKLKKDCLTYQEIGTEKMLWAQSIGQYMNLYDNRSPSFQFFIHQMDKRLAG